MQHYPSFRRAIKEALPELTFASDAGAVSFKAEILTQADTTLSGTGKRPNGYWTDSQNCRLFFDELAKDLGFSPSDNKFWATLGYKQVIAKKVPSFSQRVHSHAMA